jgi:hypothetical protein
MLEPPRFLRAGFALSQSRRSESLSQASTQVPALPLVATLAFF